MWNGTAEILNERPTRIKTIPNVISKIIKLTNKFIFGLEYYSEETVEISYRGKENSCWKKNYPQFYLNSDKSLVTTFEATQIDNMSRFGYESSKTGFSVGTSFY